jgi:hypothetical protein
MTAGIFWAAVAFVAYAYAGYPLLLAAIAGVRRRGVRRAAITPPVAFVIAARNEARRIREKLDNTLAQDYPRERLAVLVASDASDDGTDDVVRAYAPAGVRLVRAPVRAGKEAAQRGAIAASREEILVFSDVATLLPPDGVRQIVANFADPTVGCASSVDRVVDAGGRASGEGAYVRYEMALRALETRAGTVVGLSGSFFAARRVVCRDWPPDVPSDFHVVVSAVRRGLRAVSDPHSVGYYRDVADGTREFDRKVRTVLRGMCALRRAAPLLNPLRHGLFAWQLASHKLCRWLVPPALLVALVSGVALAGRSPLYATLGGAQVAFYLLALGGLRGGRWLERRLLRIPTFFLLVNASILHAWVRYVRGERLVAWTPSER